MKHLSNPLSLVAPEDTVVPAAGGRIRTLIFHSGQRARGLEASPLKDLPFYAAKPPELHPTLCYEPLEGYRSLHGLAIPPPGHLTRVDDRLSLLLAAAHGYMRIDERLWG